jgi:predicted ATPase
MRFPQTDRPTNPEDYSAVRLFAQHARRIRADFSLADEEAGVVRICALVEGMPLGIELAATWVRALSCGEIADEIERSLDILATSSRNASERHRNMRAVLDRTSKDAYGNRILPGRPALPETIDSGESTEDALYHEGGY